MSTTMAPWLNIDASRDRVAEIRGRECMGVVWRIGIAMALLLVVFSVFDTLGHAADERLWRLLTNLIPAAILGVIVLAARRGRVNTVNAGWFVMVGSLSVSGSVLVTALLSGQSSSLVYLIIMIVVNGACALDVRQFAATQTVPMLGPLGVVLLDTGVVPSDAAGDWVAIVLVALAASIAIFVARARGFEEMARVQEFLEQQAIEDPLTGLGTRRALAQMADVVTTSAEIAELSVFVVFIDVDGLKSVNDAGGHEVGDRVLLSVAQALRESARSRDVLVRWGGDEFAVLGIGDAGAPERWAASLTQRVAALNPIPEIWAGSVSVGTAITQPGNGTPSDLVARADASMYENRRSGNDRRS